MTQKLIDLREYIHDHLENYLLHNFVFPDVALTNEQNWIEGETKDSLETYWSMWGHDSDGGRAYFGLQKDVELLEEQIVDYLQTDACCDSEYYLKWNLPHGFSLILFYLWGYTEDILNITQENVLLVPFGSSINDKPLLDVLETQLYIQEWQCGKENVNPARSEHLFLIEQMKRVIHYINNS